MGEEIKTVEWNNGWEEGDDFDDPRFDLMANELILNKVRIWEYILK